MPVARCFFDPKLDLPAQPEQLLREWSQRSGVQESLLTLDLSKVSQRVGQHYLVITTLWLPTAWSLPNSEKIQLGLANSLSVHCRINLSEIMVITHRINSGWVVENGERVCWEDV